MLVYKRIIRLDIPKILITKIRVRAGVTDFTNKNTDSNTNISDVIQKGRNAVLSET